MDEKWKVIAVDNYARDSVSDWLVCDNVHSQLLAQKIAKLLNTAAVSSDYFTAVPGDHELYVFEP